MTPRDRRALRNGILAVGVALGVLRIGPWVAREHGDMRDRVSRKAAAAERLSQELAMVDSIELRMASVQARMAGFPARLLSGGTDAGAAADLTMRLRAILGAEGAAVEVVRPAPDSFRVGTLARVSLDIQSLTDTPGLTGVMAHLARDSTTIVLRQLRIMALNPGPAATVESLRVNVLVAGWYLADGAAE